MSNTTAWALCGLALALLACSGPNNDDARAESSAGGSAEEAAAGETPPETSTDETSTDETSTDETSTGESPTSQVSPRTEGTPEEAPADTRAEDTPAPAEESPEQAPTQTASVPARGSAEHPDAQSSTPSTATYTRCEGGSPDACEDCGLTVALRRRRGWRRGRYEFEVLTEGNHIRCSVTLPCDSPEPVACRASPGAPQVHVITEGCGGEGRASIAALRFPADACPGDVRVEGFRDGVGAGSEDLRLRYAERCDGACRGRSATFTLIR